MSRASDCQSSNRPPPLHFFSVRLALLGCTVGLHIGRVYVLTVPPSLTRQAIAPQPETMLSQCWPCRAGQCLDVVAVNGLQVGDQDTMPMPEQFKTKLANVHANPGGFKRLLCVLHKAKAGPKARPLS